jgi:hypothetical protein
MFDILPIHRRGTSRHAVSIACEGVRELGFQLVGRKLLDLSAEGAFLASDVEGIALGEEVFLSFRAPRTRHWMDARAIVVRRSRGLRRDDFEKGLGLHFIEMDGIDRALLSAAIVRLPPPIPTRPRFIDYAGFVRDVADGFA